MYSIHIYFHISLAGSEMGAAGDQAKKCVEKPGKNWEDNGIWVADQDIRSARSGSLMDFGDLLSLETRDFDGFWWESGSNNKANRDNRGIWWVHPLAWSINTNPAKMGMVSPAHIFNFPSHAQMGMGQN